VVAADAGPMGIEWIGGGVGRWTESAQRGETGDLERGIVVGEASWLIVGDPEEREEEIYWSRRHGRTESAETPRIFEMLIVASCGNLDLRRWGAELNFGGRESLDDSHRPITVGAKPKIAGTGGADLLLGLGC
jgi:hypothetical protein